MADIAKAKADQTVSEDAVLLQEVRAVRQGPKPQGLLPQRHPLAETRVTFTAGTAFKAGFFGLFGAFSALVFLAVALGLGFGILWVFFLVFA